LKAESKIPFALIMVCLLCSNACTTLGYYTQSISGQMDVLLNRKRISGVIDDPDTDELLRTRLSRVVDILEFAHHDLYLPDNGSYRHYTDLNRKFVVWNVVAAPEFSIAPKEWCYPVVGCMKYRGFFSEEDAKAYARSLRKKGMEVYIGGVTAYSTLGWFRDPVLNTMLEREEWELARLLFHELVHQLIYIKGDTDFNEAFADTVAMIGLQSWLETKAPGMRLPVMELFRHEREFTTLALDTRNKLQALYASGKQPDELRRQKARLINELQTRLLTLQAGWSNVRRYQDWITGEVNNARLALVSTYRALVPDFMALYAHTGEDLQGFYGLVRELSECPGEYRLDYLRQNTGREISCGN
jgi:predicted aminopeptidase